MLDHYYENRSEEIIQHLLDNEGDDLDDAIVAIYGNNIRFEDLPEEYILDIHQHLLQCFNCACWYEYTEVDEEIGLCNECS